MREIRSVGVFERDIPYIFADLAVDLQQDLPANGESVLAIHGLLEEGLARQFEGISNVPFQFTIVVLFSLIQH